MMNQKRNPEFIYFEDSWNYTERPTDDESKGTYDDTDFVDGVDELPTKHNSRKTIED